LRQAPLRRIVDRIDLAHSGLDAALQERARHLPEIDAQIFDARSVGNRKIGGHANKDFMQCQPPRLERDEFYEFQASEVTQFFGVGNVGEDVFRSKDRAIVAKVRWNPRLNPRVPRTELRIRSICGEGHGI